MLIANDALAPDTLTDRALVYIYHHLAESVSANRLASDLDVSLRTLQRSLSASLGCSPSELITAVRMREARRMLLSGRWRVSEVAYRVGFSSPSHFSHKFKSYYRVAPSELKSTADGEIPELMSRRD